MMRRAGVPGVGIRYEAKTFLGAVKRLPAILKRKLQLARSVVRTDEEIFQLINTPPADAIRKSEVDFGRDDCAEQLGKGWYGHEIGEKGGYRWIDLKATAFLRTPKSGGSHFAVEGYVPPLSRYGTTRLHLTVQIGRQSRVFDLTEGEFAHSWYLTGLESGSIQTANLSVERSIQQTTDKRRLGIIVFRFGFKPSALRSTSSPAVGPGIDRTKRILFVTAFAPAPNFHAGGQRIFRVIQGLSRFHEITLLTFLEEEKERERLASVSTYLPGCNCYGAPALL